MKNRLFALALGLAGAVFGILPGLTRAQAADPAAGYPNQPVRMVIGFAAGGPTDVIGRLLAQQMSTSMGQTGVVENRPAAAAWVATMAIAARPPALPAEPALNPIQPTQSRDAPMTA